ncbi:MAG: amidohydrolase family protein [Clostridiales bacterium]|nr:amidohydrolase family protein [Candidatus Crickella equi]
MKNRLFFNGIIHSMCSEEDTFYGMLVTEGRIARRFDCKEQVDEYIDENTAKWIGTPNPDMSSKNSSYQRRLELPEMINLNGKHVYPCLTDGHTHLLQTVASMATGFNCCDIIGNSVEPHTLEGVEARVREYASDKSEDAILVGKQYVITAIDERRMPTKEELDDWAGGRAIVLYGFDGHSTAHSTAMLEKLGIDPETTDGVLQGEANETAQGRIIDTVGESLGVKDIANGVAKFHNYCGEYGINIVGALEGNEDSKNDVTTKLIIALARHFDIGVRLYLQYTTLDRVKPYRRYMKHLRLGGCGNWEMDGASGSHSAAFRESYIDTGETHDCYYSQEFVNRICKEADSQGYQIASHAIGDCAIERIVEGLNGTSSGRLHRIEHSEFFDDETFEELKKGKYALMMQPGYSWIDKRYLHTYEQVLPQHIRDRMKFKSIYDAGIIVCGSSDSPVQEMNPFMQMLGMVQFYNEEESITPYQALTCYTVNPAKALQEYDDYGTLEVGKVADFFTAEQDFAKLTADEVAAFRPVKTYYGGKPFKKWKGTVAELAAMMLTRPKKI